MICMVKDKMPHAQFFTSGEICYSNIQYAYKDLSTACNGVKDFISILDGIFEGVYSLTEVTIAGLILTEALEGHYKQSGLIEQNARYIRINEIDIIYLTECEELLTNVDFNRSSFFSRDLTSYKLKPKRVKK